MVITTNILDREALCEQITERTVSRLTEMCDELPLLGHDRRMDAARLTAQRRSTRSDRQRCRRDAGRTGSRPPVH